jgi:hypothetical protein
MYPLTSSSMSTSAGQILKLKIFPCKRNQRDKTGRLTQQESFINCGLPMTWEVPGIYIYDKETVTPEICACGSRRHM